MEVSLSFFSNFCGLNQIEITANLPDSRSEFRRTFRDSRSQPRNIQDSIPSLEKMRVYDWSSEDSNLIKSEDVKIQHILNIIIITCNPFNIRKVFSQILYGCFS